MATAAQITANQHNSALSTGPKTPEGKAAAAQNSTKHGLSGAFAVLSHEDQDEFDVLLARLRDEFQPASEHEQFLVEQMAQARWRLSRARRLETAMFEQMLKGVIPADDDQRIAAKLLNGGDRALGTMQRYATAAERSYYKAHAELLKSRQIRNEANPVQPRVPNEPKPINSPLVTRYSPLSTRSPLPAAADQCPERPADHGQNRASYEK
jgi:hypothetical protein